EAAPLRLALFAVLRGGVEVDVLVPTLLRYLGDGVLVAEHVGPEAPRIGRAGEHAGDADNRDVRGRRVVGAFVGCEGGDSLGRAFADVAAQLAHRHDLASHRRDLADHEHALARLRGFVRGNESVAVAFDSLRGDSKSAEVQSLERGPRLFGRLALRFESL